MKLFLLQICELWGEFPQSFVYMQRGLCVCWSQPRANPAKRPNRQRCRLRYKSGKPKEPCIKWESQSPRKRQFYRGTSFQLTALSQTLDLRPTYKRRGGDRRREKGLGRGGIRVYMLSSYTTYRHVGLENNPSHLTTRAEERRISLYIGLRTYEAICIRL